MQTSLTSQSFSLQRITLWQWWWVALCLTTVIKVVVACQLPMTGEEAYNFNMTNHHFLYGYYDHPGMVVVMSYLAQLVSYKTLWLRCPQLIFTTLIALMPLLWQKQFGQEKCLLASLILLCSPMSVLFVLIVNDSFLLFFTVATWLSLLYALARERFSWYLLTGICLGAAFFSKYLVLPTAVGVLLTIVCSQRLKWSQKSICLGAIFIGFFPFLAVNIVWNYQHWWDNLFMNLHSRVGTHQFHWSAILAFAAFCLLLLTPFNLNAFWALWRSRCRVAFPFHVFRIAFFVHTLFFLLLFLTGSRGLHWLFPWYVALVCLLLGVLSTQALRRVLKGTVIFMAVACTAVIIGLNLPLAWFHHLKKFNSLAFYKTSPEINRMLDQYRSQYTVMAPSYSRAAVLGMGRSYVPVWGHGSHKGYAREDDILFDFKRVNHRNILIVNLNPPKPAAFSPYFDRITMRKVVVGEATLYLIFGQGFHYTTYRNTTLRDIYQRYYRPQLKDIPYGQDYFYRKYFIA